MNFLSAQEKKIFADYVNNYAVSDGYLNRRYTEVDVPISLAEWEKAKSHHLFKMFGDSLILEKPVTFEKSKEVLREEFYNQYYKNQHIYKFFTKLGELSFRLESAKSGLLNLANIDKFIENRWGEDTIEIPLPNNKSFKVSANTKMTRILTKICKAYNIEYFNEALDALSIIRTDKRVNDTMCLSIHPLDYITMSDNAEGWDSCMNWVDAGSYRGGTLEMLNSRYVVVGYMKSDKDFENWNSKTWRELYIVDKDIISNIRAYPYRNSYLSQFNIKWLKELAEQAGYGTYREEMLHFDGTYEDNEKTNSEFFWNRKHTVYFTTDTMYNDMGRDVNYCFWTADDSVKSVDLCYSGKKTCIVCGQIFDEEEGYVVCGDCAYISTCRCSNCDESFDREDLIECDGELLCQWCYDDIAIHCIDDEYEYHINYNCYPVAVDINDKYAFTIYFYNVNNLGKYLKDKTTSVYKPYFDINEFTDEFIKDAEDYLGYAIEKETV